jgi:rsbT co-antagonist protein RsbR
MRTDLISEDELRDQSAEFLSLFSDGVASGELENIDTPAWNPTREWLAGLSRSRLTQGFSPSETATFVFSMKLPLFDLIRKTMQDDVEGIVQENRATTMLLDKLGLYTIEVYQREREKVITRQQEEMLELSTPVVQLWEGILSLPLIGTLDSARTQTVVESLLERIVETGSEYAIIDITGVPIVDTQVAQHLLKTISAARLMGADCIISGMSPRIAQTIVNIGIELKDVITRASLSEAFELCLRRSGYALTQKEGGSR